MTASRTEKSALDWLRERRQKDGTRLISEAEYEAGDRLRRDFWRASMMPRVTANYSATRSATRANAASDSALELRQSIVDARHRVRSALDAVGCDYADLLIDVCCLDHKLTAVELAAGWPKRSGKVVLQLGLRQLARHYGLLSKRSQRSRHEQSICHWGDDSYRPVLIVDADPAGGLD